MTGLRERNRIQRQLGIQIAGLRLFAERGYDETSISDIAAVANVAPRTVSLYFPAKLDIALRQIDDVMAGFVAALSERRPGEPMMATLDRWLHDVSSRSDQEIEQLTGLMFARNPGIQGLAGARIHDVLGQAIGPLTRDIPEPDRSFATGLVAAASSAVVAYLLATLPHDKPDAALVLVTRFLGAGIAALETTAPIDPTSDIARP